MADAQGRWAGEVVLNVALRSISLFAGCGGLDLGVHLALGEIEPVLYIERDAETASILVARIEDGSLPPAHVWSDATTFDGRELRGKIDLLHGGFPCQDISVAGRGEGIVEGNRSGLWFEFARLIREIRPRLIILENVGAIVIRGLDTVLGDLAALGFDAEWMCLRASDVGASHRRERWFCVAMANDQRGRWREGIELPLHPWRPQGGADAEPRGQSLAHAGRELGQLQQWGVRAEPARGIDGVFAKCAMANPIGGSSGERREPGPGEAAGGRAHPGPAASGRILEHAERSERSERWPDAERRGYPEPRADGEGQAASGAGERGEDLADTAIPRLEERGSIRGDRREEREAAERDCGDVADAERERSEAWIPGQEQREEGDTGRLADDCGALPLFAPGPSDPRWPALLVRYPWLRPAISQAEAQSAFREFPDGTAAVLAAARTDALRAGGNSVVPLQAAAAIRELLRRFPYGH